MQLSFLSIHFILLYVDIMYLLQNFPDQNHFWQAFNYKTLGTQLALCAGAEVNPKPLTCPRVPGGVSPWGGSSLPSGGIAGWHFSVCNSPILPAAALVLGLETVTR